MSQGYVAYGNRSGNRAGGAVIAWNQANSTFANSGIAAQTLVTINLPAGTFTGKGQSIMVEFWGELSNTTGDTYLIARFDGNDMAGTINTLGTIPSAANTRSFYFKGMVTCITPTDEFLQNGIATFTDNSDASVRSYVLAQNAGGNPFAGAHQIVFDVEGQGATAAMTITVNNLLVTFFAPGTNVFP